MVPTKFSSFLSAPLIDPLRTNSSRPTPLRYSHSSSENRAAWQMVIDYQLIEWGSNSERFEDEGIDPPNRSIVQIAIQLAEKFAGEGFAPPTRVVPDANGGIVFERREKNTTEVFHIWDDGEVEYQRFEGTHLVERRPM